MVKNRIRLSFAFVGLMSLTACSTLVSDTTGMLVRAIGPKADKTADGQFVLPEFSEPDTGLVFSTSSPAAAAASFRAMVAPLEQKEKIYLTRVLLSLSGYKGCIEHGVASHNLKNSFIDVSRRPSQCRMTTTYTNTRSWAIRLLNTGRPDGDVTRVVQSTIGGVPSGDPELRGYNDSVAWQKWIDWSGYDLNGKTRSELMQQFLQGTGGTLGSIPLR